VSDLESGGQYRRNGGQYRWNNHTAINDKALYETIVAHRYKFSRVGDVDYNLHNPNTLNPIPIEGKMGDWEADYGKMMEEMIYEEHKPSFDDLIYNMGELRKQLQTLAWTFELSFPIPNL
jgi:hypothetical protein